MSSDAFFRAQNAPNPFSADFCRRLIYGHLTLTTDNKFKCSIDHAKRSFFPTSKWDFWESIALCVGGSNYTVIAA